MILGASPLGALPLGAAPSGGATARAALNSPLGATSAYVKSSAVAFAALHTPLGQPSALVIERRSASASLPTPLGYFSSVVSYTPPVEVQSALSTPLGAFAAVVSQPASVTKTRVVYAQHSATALTFDLECIAEFSGRGWTVTVIDSGTVPSDPAYYDDVALLVVGAAGAAGTSYLQNARVGAFITGLPVPIFALNAYTACSTLGFGTSYGPVLRSGFTRMADVTDLRAEFSSVSFATAHTIYNINATGGGVSHDYFCSSTALAGVARKTRSVGGTPYEDVFWGAHRMGPTWLTANAATLLSNYSGGVEDSPREARVALSSPLGLRAALVRLPASGDARLPSPLGRFTANAIIRRQARARLASPLELVAPATGLGAVAASALLALPSPLGALSARIDPALVVSLRLPSPLGVPTILVHPTALTHVALASPLGALRARLTQPRATIPAAIPAGRPRLLADPLPLRRGTDLTEYRTDAILPWVYGRVTLSPLPLDAEGLQWLVADHPILAVTAVRDEGVAVSGWELEQRTDATGHPIAVLRLTRKPAGELAVDLAGRRHAVTGALLEHPADIADDLCQRCQRTDGDWSALRSGWPGPALGAAIDTAMPLRDALGQIMAATGARWSGAPLRAWVPDAGSIVGTMGASAADDAGASADATELATRLTVAWGWDWAANAPRGSVIVEAPEAIERYGEIAEEIRAPWLRTARDALALAQAELKRLARPRWEIVLRTGLGDPWRPGDRLLITHPWVPIGPAEISRIEATSSARDITLTRGAGPVPRVETVRHGALVDPEATEQAGVTYRDGVATFTILDDTGAPIAGAAVTLDGAQTAYTDRQGRVQFRTSRGDHTLTVVAAGYATMVLDVVV